MTEGGPSGTVPPNLNSATQREFAQALYDACTSEAPDYDQFTKRIRDALLNFGSQTDDNVACAETTAFGVSRNRDTGPANTAGLLVSGTNYLVSDILAALEDDDVFELAERRFPTLTRKQVEGALRMATLVLLAFQRNEGSEVG